GFDRGHDIGLGDVGGAVGRDADRDRPDPSPRVGTAGGGVVLRGIDQRLDTDAEGVVGRKARPPPLLEGVLGRLPARARRLVVVLLPSPSGGVVIEDATLVLALVEAAEE